MSMFLLFRRNLQKKREHCRWQYERNLLLNFQVSSKDSISLFDWWSSVSFKRKKISQELTLQTVQNKRSNHYNRFFKCCSLSAPYVTCELNGINVFASCINVSRPIKHVKIKYACVTKAIFLETPLIHILTFTDVIPTKKGKFMEFRRLVRVPYYSQ